MAYIRELSDEELVRRYREGDPEAIEEILGRYKRTVCAKARKYFLMGGDQDDLIQEGMIGLFKAVKNYEESKGVSFKSFAGLCIDHHLINALESASILKHQPLNNYVSLNKPEDSSEPGILVELPDQVNLDPEETYITEESNRALRKAFERGLSRMEREVLEYFLEGRSRGEIGELLGKNTKQVDNALTRIRKKILENFQD